MKKPWIDENVPARAALCNSCGAPIKWVKTLKGKFHPVDLDGETHFATCPHSKDWSKKGRGEGGEV